MSIDYQVKHYGDLLNQVEARELRRHLGNIIQVSHNFAVTQISGYMFKTAVLNLCCASESLSYLLKLNFVSSSQRI